MNQAKNASLSFWLTILVFTFIVNLTMMRLTFLHLIEIGANLQRATWSGMLVICFGIMLICVWLIFYIIRFDTLPFNISSRFSRLQFDSPWWRGLGFILFLAILFLIPYIKFTFEIGQDVKNPVRDPVLMLFLYYWMCWWALLFAMWALKVAFETTWQVGFASALILLGVTCEILIRFNLVTSYPLSMGWSEGSRYYYASLYFSKWIYGESFPLSTLHPTRYLLQSLPFLIPDLGLAVHRFWQFILWIGLAAGAITIARRSFFARERPAQWLAAGWLFLFLLRVGVYYHLEVMVIIPLLFVSAKHPWKSLIAVIVASIWAGISRVNWFPMPAMIAIAIYLLEMPFTQSVHSNTRPMKGILSYLSQPALWTVTGLLSALLAQVAYIFLSGNSGNADTFTSSFTSDLLWYRLWPNENHALGIVPAILIVSGPLILTIIIAARQWKSLHPIRWRALFLMILALFAGSLVVSTKIGGGGDLHNMDTYAVLIGIVAAYFIGGQVQVEVDESRLQVRSWPLLTTAAVMPIIFLIPLLYPHPKYDENINQQAYQQLIQAVNAVGKNGPVLFINERQLVALGDVNVSLVYDYEVVTLMEMAMSGNQAYLGRFYNDLSNHRFAGIVATKQNTGIKEAGAFFEENNVWNSRVSPYILCHYTPILMLEPEENRIELYVPATESSENCP